MLIDFLKELPSDLRYRLRAVFGRGGLDRELDDELRFHVEHETEKLVRSGLAPDEAARQAHLAFGSVEQIKEESRDTHGLRALDDLMRDTRYALSSLRRTPAFTVVATVTLAMGIAVSTTVFSLVDAAMIRPVPFADADRLMLLNITQRTPAEGELRLRWSWQRFRLLEQSVRSFDGLASSSNVVVTITGVDEPAPLPIEIVSSRYLHVMRARLILGHGFTPNEDLPGAASPLVVLGYGLWQERFGGAGDIIGRTFELNGVGLTVAGVAARDFAGISGLARAWIPAGIAPRVSSPNYLTTNQNFITVMGRLRQDVREAAALAEMNVIGPRIQAAQPSEADTPEDRFSATLLSVNEARVDIVTSRALMMLAGAVGALLLIACANVASLLLGRAAVRRREIAIRLAIGASRSRLVRQLLTESGVLASLSAVAGLIVAIWAMTVVRIPPTLARGRNFYGAVGEFATPAMDWRVLLFVVAICVFTVLLFGLVPALQATRTDLVNDIKRGVSRGARGGRLTLREFVVALQLALSVMLLVGCGLLLTSYTRLRETGLGFDPNRLVTFMIRPSEIRYGTAEAPALLDRVLEEIGRVPGVDAASVDGCAPLTMQCASASLHLVGREWVNAAEAPMVLRHYVAPDHFRMLGVPVLRGRGLVPQDRAGRPHVVVINEAAAQRFWPNGDPIGKRVWFDGAPAFGSADSSAEIVGIVRNVVHQPLDNNPVQPDFFTAYPQFTYPTRMVLVRTRSDPMAILPEIARAVRRADPNLALMDVKTMDERARVSWSKQQFQTTVFGVIAAVALAMACAGVYAVTSYFVASRAREIGVRVALGASSTQIVRASIARTARLGMAGGFAGLVGALVLSRFVRSMLYDTSPLDPTVFAAVTGALVTVLLAASYLPVQRALRVNPIEVLRSE